MSFNTLIIIHVSDGEFNTNGEFRFKGGYILCEISFGCKFRANGEFRFEDEISFVKLQINLTIY